MPRISKRGKGQTRATQGPSPGKTPGRGRLLPLEDLGCSSFHGCYQTPPFLVLYIPVLSPLQMKMKLPVASQETGRCGFTLAQQEFLLSTVFISNIKYMFVKASISSDCPIRLPVNTFYNSI